MKRTLVIVGLVAAVIAGWTLNTLHLAGVFRSIEPHGPEPRVLTGFDGGTEDLVFRRGGDQVFVSSANFADPSADGHLYLVEVPGGEIRDVTPELEFSFVPHGIGLWSDDETERLFVVNHRDGSGFTQVAGDISEMVHSIEVFDVADDGTLTHRESFLDDALVSPNEVAPVDGERFYVTNDHGFGPGFARTLEDWLRLPVGNVVYWDGEKFSEAWGGTRYANGIAVAPGAERVYLAESLGGVVRALRREEDGQLFRLAESDRYMGLDNLSIAPDGAIWTVGHPKLLDLQAHGRDPSHRSPSQVLRFEFDGEAFTAEEIYLNDGDPMSGATVAATNGEFVLVGDVIEPKMLLWER